MSSQINKTSRAESNVEKVYKYTSAANKCTRVDKVVWAVLSESTAGGQARGIGFRAATGDQIGSEPGTLTD